MRNKGFLSEEKPIILLGEYWSRLLELVAVDDANSRRYLLFANRPEEVVDILKGRG